MRDDPIDLQSPSYTPVRLLNETAYLLGAKNCSALALILEVDQAVISRVFHRKDVISDELMVKIMDRTGWHISYVRLLAGMPFDGGAKLRAIAQRIGYPPPYQYVERVEAPPEKPQRILSPKGRYKRAPWTEEGTGILVRNYSILGPLKCMELLPEQSYGSIHYQATKLGLTTKPGPRRA